MSKTTQWLDAQFGKQMSDSKREQIKRRLDYFATEAALLNEKLEKDDVIRATRQAAMYGINFSDTK